MKKLLLREVFLIESFIIYEKKKTEKFKISVVQYYRKKVRMLKNKIITLIIMIFCSINLLAGWAEYQDGLLNSSVDSDINEEIEDLLCYQNKIIVDDDYAYMCKNGEISWYESHSNDEDDPWQLDELDGVSLFDTDNPRLIRINGSLF